MSSASYQPVPTNTAPSPTKRPLWSRYKVLLLALAFCVVALGSYKVGQWSVIHTVQHPDAQSSVPAKPQGENFEDIISSPPPTANPAANSTDTDMSNGKASVGYFVNWGIYGRKYPPSSIPTQDLTHLLYAFANLKADTGEVVLSDDWADKDIHYPGDSWNDSGDNLYGNFKAIYNLKKANRHLKVLLSIGGWTYSPSFHPVVVSPALRAKFVESSVKLVEDYGLDGLDIDYEYPGNAAQAAGYVELLKELRQGLDAHARNRGYNYKFLLTIAAPCGPDNYQKLHVKEMDQYLDNWNMMAYDFSGSWDQIANHQANLFGGPISAAASIQWYIAQGVPRSKIIMGIPLYGRSFMNTAGPGTPFSGVGPGSWEQGTYDYRALPLPGAYVYRDEAARASWTYDHAKQEMVSFDTEEVGVWKGQWIQQEGLGGSMFWELSGDKGTRREGMEGGPGKDEQPGQSLVKVVKDAMGGLEQSSNWLRYEGSRFDNMRKGMP